MLSPPGPLVDFASKCLASLALMQAREAEIHTRQGIIKHAPAESAGGLGMLSPQETRTPAGARISCGECPCRPRGSALGSIQNRPSPWQEGMTPTCVGHACRMGTDPFHSWTLALHGLRESANFPPSLSWKGTPHPRRCSLLGGVGKQPYPFIGLGSLPPARRHGPHDSRTGSHSERSPGNVATTANAHKQKGPPAPEDGAGGPLPAECSPGSWERAAGTLLAPLPYRLAGATRRCRRRWRTWPPRSCPGGR